MEIDFSSSAPDRVACEDCGIMFTPAKTWHSKCSGCVKVPYQVDDDEDDPFGSDFHEVTF